MGDFVACFAVVCTFGIVVFAMVILYRIVSHAIADDAIPQSCKCERCEALEESLRSLASWLGVGGYNSEVVDPVEYEQKIRDGVDALLRVEAERARK